jgi:hypothetical protein
MLALNLNAITAIAVSTSSVFEAIDMGTFTFSWWPSSFNLLLTVVRPKMYFAAAPN